MIKPDLQSPKTLWAIAAMAVLALGATAATLAVQEIGRASCRDRV